MAGSSLLTLDELRKHDSECNDHIVRELEQLVEDAAFYFPAIVVFIRDLAMSGLDKSIEGLESAAAKGHLKASEMDKIRLKASEIKRRVARGPLVPAVRV